MLTTFITPLGGFASINFHLEFPVHLKYFNIEVLSDLPGVLCHVDNILIYGKDMAEHNSRLHATLHRIKTAGIILNKDKCHFNQKQITFLGHVIDQNGISPDPKKKAAIQKMTAPTSVSELRHGESNEQIFSQHRIDLKTTKRSIEYKRDLDMDTSPG